MIIRRRDTDSNYLSNYLGLDLNPTGQAKPEIAWECLPPGPILQHEARASEPQVLEAPYTGTIYWRFNPLAVAVNWWPFLDGLVIKALRLGVHIWTPSLLEAPSLLWMFTHRMDNGLNGRTSKLGQPKGGVRHSHIMARPQSGRQPNVLHEPPQFQRSPGT